MTRFCWSLFSTMNRSSLRAVHDKTNGRCWYCSATLHPLSDWQVEHQQPRAQGGGDDLANLVPACKYCNTRKGNRTVDQFRHSLLVRLEHAITSALEISQELEEQTQPTECDLKWADESLAKITSLLEHAGDIAVNLDLRFYGETLYPHQKDDAPPTIETETTA